MNNLNELKLDCATKQKKGLHFIIASVFIWLAITLVHLTGLPILTKNLITFCCTAPLLPIAYLFSRVLKIDFQNKGNPLTSLGILFSLNQILYLLIAMWVFNAVPEKMVMILAMIFGAHLLPYSWLYQSKSYFVAAIAVPLVSLIIGLTYPPFVVSAVMMVIEVVFSLLLAAENKRISGAQ